MLVQQRLRHGIHAWIEGKGLGGELCDKLQHRRIVRRAGRVCSPRERTVPGHQNSRMPQRVQSFESFDNYAACVEFVIGLDFTRRQGARARHLSVEIIGVRRAQSRNAAARLSPGRRVQTMRVSNSANAAKSTVKFRGASRYPNWA